MRCIRDNSVCGKPLLMNRKEDVPLLVMKLTQLKVSHTECDSRENSHLYICL